MKRGRKDLFTKNGRLQVRAIYEDEEVTPRTLQARYYHTSAQWLISEAASEYPILEKLFHLDRKNQRIVQKPEILEQLGRMLEQDGYSRQDVITIARASAELLADGWTVKAIKGYITEGRRTGEW